VRSKPTTSSLRCRRAGLDVTRLARCPLGDGDGADFTNDQIPLQREGSEGRQDGVWSGTRTRSDLKAPPIPIDTGSASAHAATKARSVHRAGSLCLHGGGLLADQYQGIPKRKKPWVVWSPWQSVPC